MNQSNYRNNRFVAQQNKSFFITLMSFMSFFNIFNWFGNSRTKHYGHIKPQDKRSHSFRPLTKSTNCALKQALNMKKCHGHLWNGSIIEVA